MRPDLARAARDPRVWVAAAVVAFSLVAFTWGLPYADSWAADSISPRACGLGAVAETYLPGHCHHYGPLHILLLQVLALPWLAVAVARVGADAGAIERAMIEPLPMTAIELVARAVSTAMLVGIVWSTMRLWERLAGRRAGVAAGVVVATNATFIYYAHTGNLEIPYLFWSTLALVELDRVLAGEDERALPALLFAVAGVVTKDQAAAAFVLVLPFCLAARPALLKNKRVWRAIGLATLAYAVVSGAIPNPVGYARHVALITGPASQTWAMYPTTFDGRVALAHDFLLSVPRYTSWDVAIAAGLGVVIALWSRRGIERARIFLPFLAATSFTLLATFGGRRTEDRFLLPEALFFFPYAAITFEACAKRVLASRPGRLALALACAFALAPALLAVASLDGTLLADARYEAERFLRGLPAGTRVEVYGGPRFLPRFPASLVVTRVGTDDPNDRTHVPGITELRDRPANVVTRRPDYVLLSTEFSRVEAANGGRAQWGVTSYASEDDARFFGDLFAGRLGYTRVEDAECELPAPLTCRRIHGSTGEPVWIYRRSDAPSVARP